MKEGSILLASSQQNILILFSWDRLEHMPTSSQQIIEI